MPFASKKQQKWMFAVKPEMAKRWAKKTDFAKLPESASVEEEKKAAWSSLAPDRISDFAKQAIPIFKSAKLNQLDPGWLSVVTGKHRLNISQFEYATGEWLPFTKDSAALSPLAKFLNFAPNSFNKYIGGPTPLLASLTGGLAAAGLGYGVGRAVENVVGEDYLEPGKLRRNAAILSGLLGVMPGAYLGLAGMRENRLQGKTPIKAWVEPNVLFNDKQASLSLDIPEWDPGIDPGFVKMAEGLGGLFVPEIPVDKFSRAVWQDPYTPIPLRAATTGLLSATSRSAQSSLVSPFDVGRLAAGMGSGLLSGIGAGKVLGTLAGLSPYAQKQLQQAGIWAGFIKNVIPPLFGF